MAKKQDDEKRGGAREGAGRRSLYSEPLERIVAVQLDEDQGAAICRYAKKHNLNVTFLMREATLEKCGHAHLGLGFADVGEHVSVGWAEPSETAKWPLKFTARQHAALVKVASKLDISLRKLVLECTLSKIGAEKLGEAGNIENMRKVLGKIGGAA
jgi:hypothetical protein